MTETRQQAERARQAFLGLSTTADRTRILQEVADALLRQSAEIVVANRNDLHAGIESRSLPFYKRLIFDTAKLRDVVDGIRQIAAMKDPVGLVMSETELDEGLVLRKVQTPIGVLAMIFESRPDA